MSLLLLFACNSGKQDSLIPVITKNTETGVEYKFIDLKIPRAVSYLEELMNYDVAKPHKTTNNIKIDSIQIEINAQWNDVEKSYYVNSKELHEVFNKLHYSVLNYPKRLNCEKQPSHIVAVDIQDLKDVNFETKTKTFYIVVSTWVTNDEDENLAGKGEQIQVNCFTQSWSFYQNITCNGNNSGNTDAATQLELKANSYYCNMRPECAKYYTYISASPVVMPCVPISGCSIINPNGAPWDYIMDQYLFLRPSSGNPVTCLTPTEMNFHVTGIAKIGLMYQPANTSVVMSYQVWPNGGMQNGTNYIWHEMIALYGKCTNIPPQP